MHNICAVYGAIIGDIAGSTLEQKPHFTYDKSEVVEFLKKGHFTDDTVLTIATLDTVINTNCQVDDFRDAYLKYGRKYPDVGYGHNFKKFLESGETINSYGNGCLMRLSPVLLKDDRLWDNLATRSIRYTHDTCDSEFAVENYIELARVFSGSVASSSSLINGYFIHFPYKSLLKNHAFNSQAVPTLRDAVACILHSDSFEDVLHKALQLGGDTDTIAAIACSLAALKYEIPQEWIDIAKSKLPVEFLEILKGAEK